MVIALMTYAGHDTVSAIDTSTGSILSPSGISTSGAGDNPQAVAFTPDGLYALIISQDSGSGSGYGITVLNTVTLSVVQSISLDLYGAPYGVTIGTVGTSVYAYVGVYYGGSVDDKVIPIDVSSPPPYSLGTPIDLGASDLNPVGLAITPNGDYVYVPNNSPNSGGSLSIITTSSGSVHSGTFSTPYTNYPYYVAITPDNADAYVTLDEGSSKAGQVAYFAVGATVPGTYTLVTVGKGPRGIAITPNVTGPQKVYVANLYDNTISYFATGASSSTAYSHSFNDPWGVAITPDGTTLYVGNQGNETVSVIDISGSTPSFKYNITGAGGDSGGMFIQQNQNANTPFIGGASSSWFGC
jgi:DNA-binding beta-propeller fold protein YncE